jgi:uncharacterized protein YmfQ (DUF2313 family)
MGFDAILQLVLTLVPEVLNLVNKAKAAADANDQVALDAIHAQATAMADALKPTGV